MSILILLGILAPSEHSMNAHTTSDAVKKMQLAREEVETALAWMYIVASA